MEPPPHGGPPSSSLPTTSGMASSLSDPVAAHAAPGLGSTHDRGHDGVQALVLSFCKHLHPLLHTTAGIQKDGGLLRESATLVVF